MKINAAMTERDKVDRGEVGQGRRENGDNKVGRREDLREAMRER